MRLEGQTQRLELEVQQRMMMAQQQQQQQQGEEGEQQGGWPQVTTPAPSPAASSSAGAPVRSGSWLGGMLGRSGSKKRAALRNALV